MGDEVFIYLLLAEAETGSMDKRCRDVTESAADERHPDTDIEAGQDVEVVLDRSKIHLFDTATGELLHGLTDSPDRESGTTRTEVDSTVPFIDG